VTHDQRKQQRNEPGKQTTASPTPPNRRRKAGPCNNHSVSTKSRFTVPFFFFMNTTTSWVVRRKEGDCKGDKSLSRQHERIRSHRDRQLGTACLVLGQEEFTTPKSSMGGVTGKDGRPVV
jgi:hypothetical protein